MKKRTGSSYPAHRPLPTAHCSLPAAFTLVELLVVIAIIGTLMALLLPAVQSAKETARQNTCRNNMRQLTIAFRGYETSRRELPGYANAVAKGASYPRMATWTIMLFPYMERTDIWSRWNDPAILPQELPAPYVEMLVCPSNPPETPGAPKLAYVVNCGRADNPQLRTTPPAPATMPNSEKLANGVFFDRYSIDNRKKPEFMQLVMSLDRIPDGASTTLMLSENLGAYKYTCDLTDNSSPPMQYEQAAAVESMTGFVWDPSVRSGTSPNNERRINGANTTAVPKEDKSYQLTPKFFANHTYYARPSSAHGNGVNVAMCGGEVFFMRDDLDYKVYEQLMTSDGKHSDMWPGFGQPSTSADNINYILSDTDFK